MHTAPMKETDGRAGNWQDESEYSCRKCQKQTVQSRSWESSCGGYEDYKFRCTDCGHTWWIDGPDA